MSIKKISEVSSVCLDDYRCIEPCTNDLCEDLKSDEETDNEPSSYLERTIFWLLLPALNETLIAATKWNVLRIQKSRFNGIDYLSEILWNNNPLRTQTYSPRLNVFEIPPFQEWLRLHPRPYYPLSWLWTEEVAALHIQKYVRGWLVRKRDDVQEMRQFWREIALKHQVLTSGETSDDAEQRIEPELDRCKRYRALYYQEHKRKASKSNTTL